MKNKFLNVEGQNSEIKVGFAEKSQNSDFFWILFTEMRVIADINSLMGVCLYFSYHALHLRCRMLTRSILDPSFFRVCLNI